MIKEQSKKPLQANYSGSSPGGVAVAPWDSVDETINRRDSRRPTELEMSGTAKHIPQSEESGDDHKYRFSVNSVDWGQ